MPSKKTEPSYQVWVPFNNVYGPWYRFQVRIGTQMIICVVQPDMDNQSFFWSVRFPAYNPKPYSGDPNTPHAKKEPLPEYKVGGREKTMDLAKAAAMRAAREGR